MRTKLLLCVVAFISSIESQSDSISESTDKPILMPRGSYCLMLVLCPLEMMNMEHSFEPLGHNLMGPLSNPLVHYNPEPVYVQLKTNPPPSYLVPPSTPPSPLPYSTLSPSPTPPPVLPFILAPTPAPFTFILPPATQILDNNEKPQAAPFTYKLPDTDFSTTYMSTTETTSPNGDDVTKPVPDHMGGKWNKHFKWVDATLLKNFPIYNTDCQGTKLPLLSEGLPVAYFRKTDPEKFTYCNLETKLWMTAREGSYPCGAHSLQFCSQMVPIGDDAGQNSGMTVPNIPSSNNNREPTQAGKSQQALNNEMTNFTQWLLTNPSWNKKILEAFQNYSAQKNSHDKFQGVSPLSGYAVDDSMRERKSEIREQSVNMEYSEPSFLGAGKQIEYKGEGSQTNFTKNNKPESYIPEATTFNPMGLTKPLSASHVNSESHNRPGTMPFETSTLSLEDYLAKGLLLNNSQFLEIAGNDNSEIYKSPISTTSTNKNKKSGEEGLSLWFRKGDSTQPKKKHKRKRKRCKGCRSGNPSSSLGIINTEKPCINKTGDKHFTDLLNPVEIAKTRNTDLICDTFSDSWAQNSRSKSDAVVIKQ